MTKLSAGAARTFGQLGIRLISFATTALILAGHAQGFAGIA